MKRIYIRKKGEEIGHVFKSHFSVLKDTVAMLPYIPFVLTGIVSEADWASCQETIIDKYELYVSEIEIDGRTKLAKSIKYFEWSKELLEKPIEKSHKKLF